eukprot:TRINITY_DN13176_c0_g1_i1.p1 TRINITY_DN13176_c0_g1~~TRINITY_DN13176_c0_g1_i1.p1  ORF type:complete len:307 (+),score=54.03 TRINITY_DN13176_c0_g1_i1:178-1098(+)
MDVAMATVLFFIEIRHLFGSMPATEKNNRFAAFLAVLATPAEKDVLFQHHKDGIADLIGLFCKYAKPGQFLQEHMDNCYYVVESNAADERFLRLAREFPSELLSFDCQQIAINHVVRKPSEQVAWLLEQVGVLSGESAKLSQELDQLKASHDELKKRNDDLERQSRQDRDSVTQCVVQLQQSQQDRDSLTQCVAQLQQLRDCVFTSDRVSVSAWDKFWRNDVIRLTHADSVATQTVSGPWMGVRSCRVCKVNTGVHTIKLEAKPTHDNSFMVGVSSCEGVLPTTTQAELYNSPSMALWRGNGQWVA